jgi:CheY-like chemotaxis protein
MKRKILIIENQKTQFDEFYEIFKEFKNYEIIPDRENFLSFITKVRKYVNTNYPNQFRDAGFDSIFEDAKTADLILMDYKLGASFKCLSGIWLAKDINKKIKTLNNGITSLPIVFMSKDQENTKKISDELTNYEKDFKNYKWVHKGYFGKEILQPDFFKEKMIPAIEDLLNEKDSNRKYDIPK